MTAPSRRSLVAALPLLAGALSPVGSVAEPPRPSTFSIVAAGLRTAGP